MKENATKRDIFFKLSDFETIRWNLWTHLVFLDIVGTIILFADPYLQGDYYSKCILNIFLPIIVILNIWAIIITFNVKKFQLLYELCAGAVFLTMSIVFLLGSLKFFRNFIGYFPKIYIFLSLATIIISFLVEFLFIRYILNSNSSSMGKGLNSMLIRYILILSVFIGVPIRIFMNRTSNDIRTLIFSIALLLLSNIYLFGTTKIYKYFYIKRRLNNSY